jgi:hypothetical protein
LESTQIFREGIKVTGTRGSSGYTEKWWNLRYTSKM